MSSQRFFAIILIFFVAAAAWVGLGRTLQYRTATLEESLNTQVNSLWGPENLVQPAPYVLSPADTKSGDVTEPLASKVSVNFEHHNRYKGLLWFSTYTAAFSGQYQVQTPAAGGNFIFALPSGADFFEDLKVTIDAEPIEPTYSSRSNRSQLQLKLPPNGQSHQITVSFTTRGRNSWRYARRCRNRD